MSKNYKFKIAGGRIECVQCHALAKSTRQQCRRPATTGKKVCKLHGGSSTGPRTPEGRKRCSQARLLHGRETTRVRNERSLASARLAVLEWAGHTLGFMEGVRTRGAKPKNMNNVEIGLQESVCQTILSNFSSNHSLAVMG